MRWPRPPAGRRVGDGASYPAVGAAPRRPARCGKATCSAERTECMASILVVDDEEGVREFLIDALESDGHETTPAADGMEALRQLHTRAFDRMITDLRMPGALEW